MLHYRNKRVVLLSHGMVHYRNKRVVLTYVITSVAAAAVVRISLLWNAYICVHPIVAIQYIK